ncbi:ABC transporter ATP-binding protein [Metabacillus herbersteinensis]|uniref:ABC transporter ATP-binding protein n=1 Tax=Metabacillus herbersteinensis TaxID=283816 RepID=A0ABV6GDU9_9BACI
MNNQVLLDVSNLSIDLRGNRLIDGVTFQLHKEEVFCLVGESGSGKSITSRAIMGLLDKRKWGISGSVHLEGKQSNLIELAEKKWQTIRSKEMALIYQNPSQALHPFFKIRSQMTQMLKSKGVKDKEEINNRIMQQLHEMNFADPYQIANSYPCQLSGGMNQRVMIAMALLERPRLLIADEATTGLDTINQQLIIKQLLELKKRYSMSILFITHDLRLVSQIADHVVVMERGKIVESGPLAAVKNAPKSSYTKELWER